MSHDPSGEPTDGSDDVARGPPDTPTGESAHDRRPAETNRDRSTTPRDIDAMTDTPNETEAASTTAPKTASTTTRKTATTTTPKTASTTHPATATDGGTPEGDPDTAEESRSRLSRLSSDDLRGLLDRIGLAAMVFLALIAGWSFYSQTGRAIRTWLDPAYQPIALAAFNLAVLLVALAGVTHQLYRIRVDDGGEPDPPRTEASEPSRTEASDPPRTEASDPPEDR